LAEARADVAAVEEKLAAQDYAPAEQARLAGLAAQLQELGYEFGMYRNLVAESRGMTETALHEHGLSIIGDIEAKAPFGAIVWDTWSRFESTFHPWVVKNPSRFREKWNPMGTIKGAQQWLSSFDYEAEILDRLRELADMVFIITHLKKHRIGGKETSKLVPNCKRSIIEKSQLRIWLRHNPDSPEPIGLVLKRIAKRTVTKEDGIQTVAVLPRRMNPCTWKEIKRYWDEPVGNRKLRPDEIPNAYELSILDGTLTEDQKMIFKLAKAEEDLFASEAEHEEMKERIQELKSQGMSPPKTARELGIAMEEMEKYW